MKFAQILAPIAMAAMAVASTSAIAAVDADAAAALFKKNDCSKCHSIDKAKKGPALKKIAANHKGKADAQAAIIKAITTGPKVKMDDGSQKTTRSSTPRMQPHRRTLPTGFWRSKS